MSSSGCPHEVKCGAPPLTHLQILTSEEEIVSCSIAACKQSITLAGILKDYPEELVRKLQPIPFDHPAAVHRTLISYWEHVAAGNLPDRDYVPYFSFSDAEIEFMDIPFSAVGHLAKAASTMCSVDFLHVMGLKLGLVLAGKTPAQKRHMLGFGDHLPQMQIAKVRRDIGNHILGLLCLK